MDNLHRLRGTGRGGCPKQLNILQHCLQRPQQSVRAEKLAPESCGGLVGQLRQTPKETAAAAIRQGLEHRHHLHRLPLYDAGGEPVGKDRRGCLDERPFARQIPGCLQRLDRGIEQIMLDPECRAAQCMPLWIVFRLDANVGQQRGERQSLSRRGVGHGPPGPGLEGAADLLAEGGGPGAQFSAES